MHRLIQFHLILKLFLNVFGKQLPDSLIPKEYKLDIITNLEDRNFNFKGSVLINIMCITPTDTITLHSKNLKIERETAVLRGSNETDSIPTILEISEDTENDFLILKLSETLEDDVLYEVELHFEADLGGEKAGYCKNSYFTGHDQQKWVAVTYFKPNNARRVFPCFDEPSFKANFTISLGRSDKFNSLSNMPLSKTEDMEDKPGWQWDHFQTTPPMPTYAVGFAIIDFSHRTFRISDLEYGLSIWGRTEDSYVLNFATVVTSWFLYAFQNYFTVKYPLPKLDLIIIPDSSATIPPLENWGLIVLNDYYFQDNLTHTAIAGELSTRILAKQMVHQWFGNLVTIKSWKELWFVDGFCKYLSTIFIDQFLPEWKLLDREITASLIAVFNRDSLQHTQSISIPSNQSAGINTMIDSIAHEKGYLIIRMMSHFLGFSNLRQAIRQYLKRYEYSNAGMEELLEWTDSSPLPRNIETVLNVWISQKGFPLITVTRNYRTGTLEVKQERFFRDRQLLGKDSTGWWVPITYTSECELAFNNTITRKWLSPTISSTIMRGPMSPADWVLFNVDASGVYLVNYDEENWNLLINFLNKPFFERIPSMNRVLLIESASSLASVGRLNYKICLDLFMCLAQEKDFHVWKAALRALNDLDTLLQNTPIHGKFMSYVRKIIANIYRNYGISHLRGSTSEVNPRLIHHKVQVISAACEYEVEDCVGRILQTFHRSPLTRNIPNTAVGDLRETFFCTAIKHSADAEWHSSWDRYTQSNEVLIRIALLRSLACTRNQALLQMLLERSLDVKSVRNEEVAIIIVAVAKNKDAVRLITKFLNENIKAIYDRISPVAYKLAEVLTEIARYIVTDEGLGWLENFIEANRELFQDVPNSVNQALEIAELNIQWRRHNYGMFEAYFKDYDEN